MGKNRVTLTSIARETGKSPQTVSKVLNGGVSNTNVSEATRKLVVETAARLGYRVNQAARAVRQGRVGSLGMLIALDSHRSLITNEMISGAVAEAEAQGFDLKIINYHDQDLTDQSNIPRIFRETLVDGFLVNYYLNNEFTNTLEKGLKDHKLPAIWMNRNIPEDGINFDDFNGGYEMTRRMLADGLRRIAYVDFCWPNPATHYSKLDRPRGYAAAMVEAGHKPSITTETVDSRSSAKSLEALRRWYEKNADVEGIILYGQTIDPAVLQVVWENNRVIGEDIHLGYFGSPKNFTLYPTYVMVQPEWTFGIQSVRMLCDKIKTPTIPLPTRSIPFCKETDYPCEKDWQQTHTIQ